MYWVDVYRFKDSIEYEYKYAGRYGAKGEKRAKKQKATPEQIKKQNLINKKNNMRRLIKQNFTDNDLWITLKSKKDDRRTLTEWQKMTKKLIDKMRVEYKKRGEPFKWIMRLEVGKRGGLHCHMIINRVRGEPNIEKLINSSWRKISGGSVNYTSLYDEGGYEQLASYITKQDPEVERQISLFPKEEQKALKKYSCSRNLVRPVPERHEYKRRTLKKIIEGNIKVEDGWYLDKSTWQYGINAYTGYGYLKYTLVRAGGDDG